MHKGLCSLMLASTLASVGVFAQNGKPVSSLGTVTVTATKSPKKTFDYPGMATVVNSSDPGVAGASKVKDLLRDVPGVEFSGSARRSGQNVTMRGYDTDGLIILLDGVRQKFEAGHDGKFFIDPYLLKRVEVVRGPHSALYGSGALGGVISFETKDASDLLAPGETAGVVTTFGFQDVNDEGLLAVSGAMRTESLDAIASIYVRRSGDIELGDGFRLKADDDVLGGLLKLGWSAGLHGTFKANVQRYRNDSEEPNNPQTTDNDNLYDRDTESLLASLGYLYHDPARPWLNAKARVYYNDIEVDEHSILSGRQVERQLDTLGASLENQSRIEVGDHLVHTLTYGGEIYDEEQDGTDAAVAGGIPDAESDYWGVFLQDEIEFAGAFGKLLFIPGLRYDDYRLKSDAARSVDESEVSPKLGLSYQPRDWLTLFVSYGEAFRAPNMSEVYATGIHFSLPPMGPGRPGGNNVFVPNPDLKPETNEVVEYGFGMRFGDVLRQDDELLFKLARFDIDAEDFIDAEVSFRPLPGTQCCGTTRQVNVPDADLHGVEFEGGYENERVKLTLGYSYVRGKDDETGEYLTNITPRTLLANFAWKLPEIDGVVGVRSTLADSHNRVNDAAEARGGYDTHDVYYQWRPRHLSSLTLDLGVDNVFDESYERVFAGSPEPGRNYRLQVSYEW